MGWTIIPNSTRKWLIEDRVKGWTRDFVKIEWIKRHGYDIPENISQEDYRFEAVCIKHCYRGAAWKGTLWTVWEHRAVNKLTGDIVASDRWIGCDMFQYRKEDNGWGYKDMDESSGPSVYTCPLSYLDMVPVPENEDGTQQKYAVDWRFYVRNHHGYRGKLKVGERLELKGTSLPWVTVANVKPLKGRGPDGTIYRLQRKFIVGVHESD